MKCEKCGKNEATVYFKNVINGKKTEMNLCADCAGELGLMENVNPFNAMSNFFGGFFPEFGFDERPMISGGAKCPVCGTSVSEIARTGYAGCSECYKTFGSVVEPIIRRIHGDVKHTGSVPASAGAEAVRKRKLHDLKHDLKEAVKNEEFERAASLRDEIRGLENGGVNND